MTDRLAHIDACLTHAEFVPTSVTREDVLALVEIAKAARDALDCKGPYNGTVPERGGEPALCTKCGERLGAALSVLDDREET